MDKILIRKLKIEKLLKITIANILIHEINDKRIKLITNILYVKISKDFTIAKIYVTFINQNNIIIINKLINILQKSSYYIYFLLKKKINLYKIPRLYFKYDEFYEKQFNLFNKLNNLVINNY